MFHRDGEPVREFHKSWRAACRRAATAGTGTVRVRAGVPERIAMSLTGHKTRSVFDRYDIVSEADLSEGVEKLAAFHAARGILGGQSAEAGQ